MGNTATGYAGSVRLSIHSGTAGATLSGCSGALSNGVTTFSGCKIDKSGSNNYASTASDGTLSVNSTTFAITVGPAAQLVFTTSPSNSTSGVMFSPNQPVVTVEDAGGNTANFFCFDHCRDQRRHRALARSRALAGSPRPPCWA